jgi:hypothetical protein
LERDLAVEEDDGHVERTDDDYDGEDEAYGEWNVLGPFALPLRVGENEIAVDADECQNPSARLQAEVGHETHVSAEKERVFFEVLIFDAEMIAIEEVEIPVEK